MPGDGIGPEICEALPGIFDALRLEVVWERMPLGAQAFHETGNALPACTVESFQRTKVAIKGPVQTPSASGWRSPLVQLRQDFRLFANVRPARACVYSEKTANIDFVVIRENTEGLYSARESYVAVGDDPRAVGMATVWNTRAGCERILRFGFDYAVQQGRKKATIVHKANVLKILSGIFLETARELHAREYAGRLVLEEMIVDACAMKMAMQPEIFDVIITTNMFGDILSDLAAGLTGGLGTAPSANIGNGYALFEPVHGAAPDIAGLGIANPSALLLSGALLLDYWGEQARAACLRDALLATLNVDGVRTPDLGGQASGAQLAQCVERRIMKSAK